MNLITGATGFVGSALVKSMVEHQLSTRVVVRQSLPLIAEGVETAIVSEINGATEWGAVLGGVKVVVHLAARVHIMNESSSEPLEDFRRTNVHGTLNLANQAAAAGVQRFIFISSIKVNGETTAVGKSFSENDVPGALDYYGISKHEAEIGLREIASRTGMQLVIIRPPLVYGPGVKANFAALINVVQKGWPMPLLAIQNKRSLVALDNLVDFIVTCIDHPQAANQTFLISDGQDVSTAELARGLGKNIGVPARLFYVPIPILQAFAALMGKKAVVQRLTENLQVDISKARILLGWRPPITVDEGLRRAVRGGVAE